MRTETNELLRRYRQACGELVAEWDNDAGRSSDYDTFGMQLVRDAVLYDEEHGPTFESAASAIERGLGWKEAPR